MSNALGTRCCHSKYAVEPGKLTHTPRNQAARRTRLNRLRRVKPLAQAQTTLFSTLSKGGDQLIQGKISGLMRMAYCVVVGGSLPQAADGVSASIDDE